LDSHGFFNGVVESGDLSLLTGLSLLSTKPTDASLSYKNLCRLCTFFCMRRGTIQFYSGGSMAQYDSGVSKMKSTRAPVWIFDVGVSKLQ
jgi:hypothetical protein